MRVCVCACVRVCVCVCACVRAFMRAFVRASMHVFMLACMHACGYIAFESINVQSSVMGSILDMDDITEKLPETFKVG